MISKTAFAELLSAITFFGEINSCSTREPDHRNTSCPNLFYILIFNCLTVDMPVIAPASAFRERST